MYWIDDELKLALEYPPTALAKTSTDAITTKKIDKKHGRTKIDKAKHDEAH